MPLSAFKIDDQTLQMLREVLPSVASQTVAAVTSEVPGYGEGLSGPMGESIEAAVQMAIGGFLKLASGSRDADPRTPRRPTIAGAYALGRGEARAGRSMDALLAAYRIGAQVSWRGLARTAVDAGLPASTMAEFAELLFAYIDELSATSVAGYNDELTTSGRVRERYRERLAQLLLSGASSEVLVAAADRAGWTPPESLTAVLIPTAQVHGVLPVVSGDTLLASEDHIDAATVDRGGPQTVLLIPDTVVRDRRRLMRIMARREAIVGPARPWVSVRSSFDRVIRTAALGRPGGSEPEPVDTEDHLVELVVDADPEALADLRRQVLAPLGSLDGSTADRLVSTLSSWILHLGRRDEVAAELHVHPQTVRYRMQQLRELYGDRLRDPRFVRELIVAWPDRAVQAPDGGPLLGPGAS